MDFNVMTDKSAAGAVGAALGLSFDPLGPPALRLVCGVKEEKLQDGYDRFLRPVPWVNPPPHLQRSSFRAADAVHRRPKREWGVRKSFDTSDPDIHKIVQGILFDINATVLEAVEAKKRGVGNTLCNLFEGLPDVPDLSEPSQPASTRLRPRPTVAWPSSRQQQLALPPVDPRETAGEPSGRAGGGSVVELSPEEPESTSDEESKQESEEEEEDEVLGKD
ncbi:uncharacterized protein FSUBG_13495 [Fusarium subglutinans]|uniref:Uncharacterized protein n=1 Tax=Gibberella subglutinans TaxID=42677 RepID=A0A8H5NUR5_GIBSU|nr:uncharacterized protein FSUBG_13495 [Fusarium subglutinans]KAF5580056.1 hypothetical protein FSUBG_13495 [Fusarium subglutinans]